MSKRPDDDEIFSSQSELNVLQATMVRCHHSTALNKPFRLRLTSYAALYENVTCPLSVEWPLLVSALCTWTLNSNISKPKLSSAGHHGLEKCDCSAAVLTQISVTITKLFHIGRVKSKLKIFSNNELHLNNIQMEYWGKSRTGAHQGEIVLV